MPPETIAITGAAGFIGSHTARALARQGHTLRLLSGASSERRPAPPVDAALRLTADITDRAALAELVDGAATVVHAAGPPSVGESFEIPAEYMRVHAVGTATLLEACVKTGVRRMVYISSAETYGNRTPAVVAETQPLSAASPYGAAKIAGEQMVRAFGLAGRLDVVVLRPFSVYGPGMSPHGVVAQFLAKASQGEPIEARDPRPIRDFCFIDDVAAAIASACSAPLDRFAVANLGSGTGTSIGDLARIIAELANAPGVAESNAAKRPPGAEISCLIADVSEARRILNWAATTSLRDGLEQTWHALAEAAVHT